MPTGDRLAATLNGYEQNFLGFALVYGIAAACWLAIDASRPIVPHRG